MSEHTHIDNKGVLHKCYHECRDTVLNWKFVLGTVIAFPLEHALYEKVYPFTLITKWLGL